MQPLLLELLLNIGKIIALSTFRSSFCQDWGEFDKEKSGQYYNFLK